jgi:hypothetical protein
MNLKQILAGSDNIKLLKWPGSDVQVAMKILSESDRQAANFAAERLFKAQKIEAALMTMTTYEEEVLTQMLYLSLRDPEDTTKPIFVNISEFREFLTKGIKTDLVMEYLNFEKETCSNLDDLTQEEFDVLYTNLKKKPDETLEKVSSLRQAKKLLLILVSQQKTLPQDNGLLFGQ